jgi:LysM repeat protein
VARLGCHAVVLTLVLLLPACAAQVEEQAATATLERYVPPTHTATTRPVTPAEEPLSSPGPTATPLTHVVERNETLLGIAIEYGISLDALLAANPGVNPRFLSIGQALIIPGPGGQPILELAPSPTPVPLDFSRVACYPTIADGLWCLVSVRNTTPGAIEGLAARISLLDGQGEALATQTAYAPLNLLPPQGVMALAAYFPPPAPDPAAAVARQISGVAVGDVTGRYLPLTLDRETEQPGTDGQSWRVTGSVALSAEAEAEGRLAVLAIGLDAAGSAVGYLLWEPEEALAPGGRASFDLVVYSLGPTIDSVVVLAEAQPLP